MGQPLRFSTSLQRFYDADDVVPFRAAFDYARQLEAAGFYSGFCGHHSFTPEAGDPSAPFMFLSAIAAITEKLKLSTGIYIAPLHHPVNVCEQVSTLDQISGGRARLGVAAGYRDYEFAGYGVPYGERGRRLNEILEICTQTWEKGRFGYDGEIFQIPDLPLHPLNVQKPRPPILVGGNSRAAIERAARQGDGWLTLPMETLPVVVEQARVYRQACERYGKTPYICLLREAWVAPSRARVEEDWLESALAFHKYYWETGTKGDAHDPVLQRVGEGERVDYETFSHDRAIAGTPEFCVAELERWQEAVGMDEIHLMIMTGQHGGRSKTSVPDMMRLFADEVMSEFEVIRP